MNKNDRFEALVQEYPTQRMVSEPGNILHPDEYARRLLSLKKVGLKVSIYDQKKLKKLSMNAYLE